MRRLFKTKVKVTKPNDEVVYNTFRIRVHQEVIERGATPEDEACHKAMLMHFNMMINSYKFECVECIKCDPQTGDPINSVFKRHRP